MDGLARRLRDSNIGGLTFSGIRAEIQRLASIPNRASQLVDLGSTSTVDEREREKSERLAS